MADSMLIHEVLEALPSSSMTTRALSILDVFVPGEWKNITRFDDMIRDVTGETDESLIQQVGERAIALYANPENGYQRAVSIYRLVDDTGALAGAAALANKTGSRFEWLSFLETITPKPDTTQAIDAALKLVGELAAFCYSSGIPGDSIGDFVSSLGNAAKEDAIRLAAWVTFDGLIPLGPDFLLRSIEFVQNASDDLFSDNSRFGRLTRLLPGNSLDEQRRLALSNLDSARSAVEGFVANRTIDRDSVVERLKQALEVADDKLDYVAAALDLTTSPFEHTGIQSVARRVISRAYGEL
ncbi:hypothetical protein AKJ09_07669 [Labilithrix luteola]|uniref:Uncharacterized protein n=1 Tax=Labilithrix luteola TaxID=1391654 RepID=A0A0K1Q596_9BACT|nr:hypothetical protein [Labilithrix luteola]AKV01006.1 hypothetical protein AKJ09_07669 [Labilithrix luteola]